MSKMIVETPSNLTRPMATFSHLPRISSEVFVRDVQDAKLGVGIVHVMRL
jgi:hypothetical protein